MEVTFDKQSNTYGVLNINLEQTDYQPAVDKKLKEYRQKANIKGFRPGMVPAEMIKRMYGTSVLVDEINHKLSHLVQDYIKDNKLAIVGDPLPVRLEDDKIDWETQKTFKFGYEIGLSGDFEIDFNKLGAIDSFEITASQKELDETIENLKTQFGEHIHGETIEDGDMVFGVFALGDWTEKSAIPMKAVKESQKSLFIGSKKGDSINFDIQDTFVDNKSLALATGKKEDEAANLTGVVNFAIEDITRTGIAELNQVLFDKVLGPNKADSEASFREQVLAIVEGNYKREGDYLLKIDVENALLDNITIELPDEFLRKWLIEVNQGKFSAEDIDRDFENVKKDLRMNLIKGKVAEMAEIKIEYAEILEKTKEMVRGQFGMYDGGMEDIIEKVATNYLNEKSEKGAENRAMQMYSQVYEEKISNAIIERMSVNKKVIDVEGFKQIVEKLK